MIKLTTVRQITLADLILDIEKVKASGRKADILKQGIVGEAIVYEMLYHLYGDVEKTADWYDSEKDGTVCGQTYEVKTIFPYKMKNEYAIETSQRDKIVNVDRLFIVEVPESISSPIPVYEIPKENRQDFQIKSTPHGNQLSFQFTSLRKFGIIDNKTISYVLNSFNATAKGWDERMSKLHF